MNKNKTGLVLGTFMGLFHLLWSGLVAFGFAQWILDFVYRIHFLSNTFMVMPFGLKRMAALVVVTFVVGYVAGWIWAWICGKFCTCSSKSI